MQKFRSYLDQLRFDPKLWNSIQAKWIFNIRLVLLLIIAVILLGVLTLFTIPRRVNPEVKIPIVTISTVLPGAGPSDIELLITKPLEDELKGMDQLDTITSTSNNNISVIVMQFLSTANKDKARDDAQALVNTVTLPEDAQTPKVTALDFENQPVWSFALSTNGDTGSLMRFANRLKDKIKTINKVKDVDIAGYDTQEISVLANPNKMRDYGLNPPILAAAIKRAANAYPAGIVTTNDNAFSLTLDPSVSTVDDIRKISITNASGQQVKLGDVADIVERTAPGYTRSYVATRTIPSEQAVTFYVYKTSSANIDEVSGVVEKLVRETVAQEGTRFTVTSIVNSGKLIGEQYAELLGEFESTLALVFINLFLFLGLRQATLATLTTPLTFLSGLIFMNLFGLTINFISLFAFLLALGTSIDDTIVVVASMTSYYRSGKFSPKETALLVWRDFIIPIWSTTVTTVWAYVPLLLTTGIIGEFIKPIPIVVTATMYSSTFFAVLVTLPLLVFFLRPVLPKRVKILFFVFGWIAYNSVVVAAAPKSFLLIPILLTANTLLLVALRVRKTALLNYAGWISASPTRKRVAHFLKYKFTHGFINVETLSSHYRTIILRILGSNQGRRITLIAVLSFAIFSYLLVPTGFVKNEFFPKSNQDTIYVNVSLPGGMNSQSVETTILDIVGNVRKIPEVTSVVGDVGRSFSGQGFSSGQNNGLVTLILQDKNNRKRNSVDIAQSLRDQYKFYPAATVTVQEVSGGPPAGSDVQIKLSGENLAVLNTHADKVVQYLNTQKGVADPQKSVKPGTSKIVFTPDYAKLADAGITEDQLALQLRTYASGFTLDKITFEDTKRDVTFRMSTAMGRPEDLGSLFVQTQNGSYPLLSLGTLELKNNPTVITREAGKRTISVTANSKPGFNLSETNKNLEKFATNDLKLPDGYEWKTGGVNEENAKSVQSIFRAMILSFILILITMVVQFRSFRQAAIVLMLIPLAISGVFIIFAITATPLSFPALIGVLSLFGVVVTNAMFIVDKINRNLTEGMELVHAIGDAAESRLEPILLTSLTSIIGLIPISIANPLWRGLGGAIIAGLSFSGIIMLFFVPVMYYLLFRSTYTRKHDAFVEVNE